MIMIKKTTINLMIFTLFKTDENAIYVNPKNETPIIVLATETNNEMKI